MEIDWVTSLPYVIEIPMQRQAFSNPSKAGTIEYILKIILRLIFII